MKGNIDITTNGYWYDDKSLYLDEYKYETKEIIDFKSFKTNFHLWDYEKNWKGNNPFTKDECLRLWINDNARVEIFVNEWKDKTEFHIYKVFTINNYENSNEIMIDMLKIDNLYKDVLKTFDEYKDEYLESKGE